MRFYPLYEITTKNQISLFKLGMVRCNITIYNEFFYLMYIFYILF